MAMPSILGLLARQVSPIRRLIVENESLKKDLAAFRTRWKPGHFYSPIPDLGEVEAQRSRGRSLGGEILGIDLNERRQIDLLHKLAAVQDGTPFTDKAVQGLRYYYDNDFYAHADGIVLHAMLRHLRPQRIVEVGSGFSSAMILDTRDRYLDSTTRLVFIDPHTSRLEGLLTETDRSTATILGAKVQDVPLSVFEELRSGDLLFVDSSHVAKAGSDLNHVLFEVVPRLAVGVHVHFHDVFFPFDYPAGWLRDGVAWNEAYLLRAFLQYNRSFEVTFFTSMMLSRHPDQMSRHLPIAMRSETANPGLADTPGSSLWMRRIA
jgi:hypothetical protein